MYKFNEDKLIADLKAYVDSTYFGHYSKNKFQASEFIIDSGLGEGFMLGNVLKYAQRYGKKAGKNRDDLMKILHYALLALYIHDSAEEEKDMQLDLFEDESKKYMYNYGKAVYNITMKPKKYYK